MNEHLIIQDMDPGGYSEYMDYHYICDCKSLYHRPFIEAFQENQLRKLTDEEVVLYNLGFKLKENEK